jgi:WS/DGAT/MGAT family acyltransferase
MKQLTGLDNSFLAMEAGGELGHVGSLSLFETDQLERPFIDVVRDTLEERLHLLEPYRRRLVEVPLELDRPYWIEDPNFDMDFHIRHIAVPAPGDEQQLSALVSRLHARALDRSRPLWELYVIEGLSDGRTGLYTKIHHCTIDGVSGSQMVQVLMDLDPNGREIEPPKKNWKPDPIPETGEMLARGIVGAATQPGRMVRSILRGARTLIETNETIGQVARDTGLDKIPYVGAFVPATGEVDAEAVPQTPAPRTPWNRSITPHRRLAYFSHSLDRYKRVKKVFGTTLNDVVMAVTGSALRAYLEERGELPEDPLVAMVPVSVRTDAEANDYTNRVTTILSELATEIADPVERLQRIHRAMKSAKRMQGATPASVLQDVAENTMPALIGQAARIAARTKIMDRMNPPFNVVISNVPGPREPLYFGRAEMLTYYPVSAVAVGQGLNVTVTSYRDHLDWGLITCRELVPDVWAFEELFQNALDELEKAAELEEGR